ncbi:MAG: ribonuclease Y [Planctomycetota bacterium]|nr:ribonuclease Y [Planctomycetota bacterium]
MEYLIGAGGGIIAGFAAVYVFLMLRKKDAKSVADKLIADAQQESKNLLKQAELDSKEKQISLKEKFDGENNKIRKEIEKSQKDVDRKQRQLEQQTDDLGKQEQIVQASQRRLSEKLRAAEQRTKEIDRIFEEQKKKLHEVTGLGKEEATGRLLKLMENELASEVGTLIQQHDEKMKAEVEERSKEIILSSIYRYAAPHTSESTTSTVDIPGDEMKGRIIGREGRNIRAFEKETGVDVIIDDTPGVVIVSSFDPIRREVGRRTLAKLIEDGRIHPARIEELAKETRAEIDELVVKKGKEAAQELEIHGLHKRVIEMLGRLHFRTSYSQNVLKHSIEVAFVSGMIAEMIGLDIKIARRAGLLHDIGKAADHELEGGHPKIGADLLKRHGEKEEVVHAAFGHHDEIITEMPYTVVVATADACSASRPGARRESLERYVKRMEELESIALEFKGIEQSFAIQAGRELRVIASSDDIDDAAAAKICRDIANACEERLSYPGEIKVTVIRESRFIELAK